MELLELLLTSSISITINRIKLLPIYVLVLLSFLNNVPELPLGINIFLEELYNPFPYEKSD